MTPRPIEELLEDLDTWTGFTKYDLVDEAVARREEIIPHLLGVLDRILADPEAWLEEEHDLGCYAIILLTFFEENRAHRKIVDLFSLPGDLSYELFSDFIGQTGPAVLVKTCGGNLDPIRELILNRTASDYCRWTACTALTYSVVSGLAERDEVVSFLRSLLSGAEAEQGSDFWTGVVDALLELHPGDSLEAIRSAYEKGLVPETFETLDRIEAEAERDPEARLAELRSDFERDTPDDIHDYMRWWQEPGRQEARRAANRADAQRRENRQRKKKNKQAKKSRRRNR